MMTVVTKIFLAIVAMESIGLSQPSNCGQGLSPFVRGTVETRLHNIGRMHGTGKQAISSLLLEIDNPSVAPVTTVNPFLSYRDSVRSRYCGEVAAYLIESVLGQQNLSLLFFSETTKTPNFLLQGQPDVFIYPMGYITSGTNGKRIPRRALKQVRELYARWWMTNSAKSLEEMRDDWQHGKRPLSGSGYDWK